MSKTKQPQREATAIEKVKSAAPSTKRPAVLFLMTKFWVAHNGTVRLH